ncbi:hypothetical protein QAD02_009899 [Eretmocerus hayati]|uniref:Uncharacterized protein n=1 Tax=Eretmocerus hayati TaxID=131215 RepID=A0ACC2NBG6_9HYME|nr:hypothetical protein QAD02_009899 [Eretmocerus hayati]
MPGKFFNLFIQLMLLTQLWSLCNTEPIKGQNAISVQMTAYPYVVVIYKRDNLNSEWKRHCTGSLVSPNRVLTAGRCLEGFNPSDLQVISGTTEARSVNHKRFDVREMTTYKQWSKNQKDSRLDEFSQDIGILELSVDDTGIKPGRFDYAEKLQKPGCRVRLIGWGTDDYGFQPWIPRGVFMDIQKEEVCQEKIKKYFSAMEKSLSSKRILCVSSNPPSYGSDADFGGPLIAESKRTIVGILIRPCPMDEECQIKEGQPNVMLRLHDFGKFIYHIIREPINGVTRELSDIDNRIPSIGSGK